MSEPIEISYVFCISVFCTHILKIFFRNYCLQILPEIFVQQKLFILYKGQPCKNDFYVWSWNCCYLFFGLKQFFHLGFKVAFYYPKINFQRNVYFTEVSKVSQGDPMDIFIFQLILKFCYSIIDVEISYVICHVAIVCSSIDCYVVVN